MSKSELSFAYSSKGISGEIKNSPEDFIVEEITSKGVVLEINKKISYNHSEGNFTYFILQKRDYTTSNAIKSLAHFLNTGQKRFNYAGTKDKVAVTTQLCSVFEIESERLLNLKIKDIQINGAWKEKEKIKLGDLLGNKFKIKINNCIENSDHKVKKILKELNGKFPNYFGEQRFGTTRRNTSKIGELILRGRFKNAVMDYLCDSEGEKNTEAVLARNEFKETLDFKKALNYFPKHLTLERTILDYLSKNPTDFVGALRKLPRPILLLFVHAFQSRLFNILLSERISEGNLEKEEGEYFCSENKFGFPDITNKGKKWLVGKIIGYESKLNQREKNVLERFMIHQDDFKVKGIPEISSKGTFRTLFAPMVDFSFNNNTFIFSLQSGSYATSVLREFIKK
ncbi:MAG: tRNA pseudouridine(13) synthase TruD [Candidatus ainarchaeum sp.]|nr:tRNA pseudouridine(13) synthase TruD [Candidatus ainarchaeum sp.]